MCNELQKRIYAIVMLRPSTPKEISRMLRSGVSRINTTLSGMDRAGFQLSEDDDGRLYPYRLLSDIDITVSEECQIIVDKFATQMTLSDIPADTGSTTADTDLEMSENE